MALPWNIEEVELTEGSRFYNHRLEVTPNEFWQEGLLVHETLENFRLLFRQLGIDYYYDRIRVYFQHIDSYELVRVANYHSLVPTSPMRTNFESVDVNVAQNAAHIESMARRVYDQLLLMSDQYSDDDDDLMERYVIIIDLHLLNEYGACGTGEYPAYFPPEFNRDTLYNPRGGHCGLKCVYRHFNGAPPRDDNACLDYARERGLPLDTETMLHGDFADAVCAATRVRVVVVNMQLDLKYCVGTFDETMVLMLSGKHYYYVYNLETLVKARWGESAFLCYQCGKVTGTAEHRCTSRSVRHELAEHEARHECVRFSEDCHKCGKHFSTVDMKKNHNRAQRYAPFDSRAVKCEGCGEHNFVSKACYNYHVKNCAAAQAVKTAEKVEKRREYLREYNKNRKNRGTHCAGCNKFYDPNAGTHECYFERLDKPEEPKYPGGIYVFDFESMFSDEDARTRARTHTVNYVVVKKLFDETNFSKHFDKLDDFVAWLADLSEQHAPGKDEEYRKTVLVLAHNFRGYDGRLLVANLLNFGGVNNFVSVGSKFNSFTWRNIQFADSLLHIAQPLDQFPKIFGLDIECKGFFPYEFNVEANQTYIGAIPPMEVFKPGKMSEKRRDAFIRWYNEVKREPYDFRAEMIKYCDLDVEIMKRGLEVYIKSAQMSCENLNPLESFTVASAAYKIWRTLHMPENVISYYGASFHETARQSLRGGRTDVRCLYRAWTPHQVFVEKCYGVYADVQSMYPHIQMTKPLPVGHPNRFYRPAPADFAGKLGFVKCSLAPPRTFQFHPAICVRDDESGRLVAPLRENLLKDIFITTVEFEQAMRQGYTALSIDYVDVYKESADLFKSYIRTFLKIKVEKSQDYPGDAKFRELYDMYRTRCGIELEAANFENNPGLKQIAKLYLNSLWGKLCERPKYDATFNVDMDDFFKLEEEEECGTFDPKLKLKINQDSWLVRGTNLAQNRDKQDRENRKKTSPAVGSFITMYGRTMLLEQMEKLGKRALYHDTDSIVYERREGEYNIPLGKCLGDWEDELKGKPMIEFVALAPKTYSYRYLDSPDPTCTSNYWEWEGQRYPVREVTKIKGVRQCFETKASIDFDTMVQLVNKTKAAITTEQVLFSWNMAELKMTTRDIVKQTTFHYGKGVVGADYYTYPPGVEQYWQNNACEQGAPLRAAAF